MNSNQLELNNSTICDHKWLVLSDRPDCPEFDIIAEYNTYDEAICSSDALAEEHPYAGYYVVLSKDLESNGNVIDMSQVYFQQRVKENKIAQILYEMDRWDISIDELKLKDHQKG